MSTSEEYLASLGIDTADMDRAVNQTISLLGHLGNQFDGLTRHTDSAERALGKAAGKTNEVKAGAKGAADEIKNASTATRGWSESLSSLYKAEFKAQGADKTQPEKASQQGAIYNQYLYDEAAALEKVAIAEGKVAVAKDKSLGPRDAHVRGFQEQIQSQERASQQQSIYNKYLFDEERALGKAAVAHDKSLGARDAHVRSFQEYTSQQEAASKQTALYNQYLYDEEKAANQADTGLARLRYAIYDVSNAMAIGGAAAAAFVTGIVGANVMYEREFANVRRTVGVTGESADDLYDKFVRLTTEIPVAFASLTEIGTLAGQLGVLETRVASFTETVAMFSATTDVSVDASATAFGRLDQLIDGVDGRYRNLASSILNVGINSVATESQIISIASQIAATGNQAGLAASEVVGLAGSLASLGVAPEAARGTVLRVFSQINSAIATGGERLNDFASVSRMSADEFRKGWSTDFTSTFLAFLEGVDANGQGAESALRGLGITATRDINAMLKLAQNSESVAANLNLAANGFDNASLLAENFGVIAETNASRLQVLIQTVQAFFSTLGEGTSGPLAHFLETATSVLRVLTAFAATPFGQGLAAFSTILGATLAVMLLVGAAATRGVGSFLALKTAIGETYIQTMLAKGGMQGFTATLFGAAGAARAFSAALVATGAGLAISVGAWLLTEAIAGLEERMKTSQQRAEEYFGTLDGLDEAIKADNAGIFAKRVDEANEAVQGASTSSQHWATVLENAAKAQEALKEGTGGSTTEIDAQTLSIGKNTQEWARNQLANNEHFREVFANLTDLKALTAETFDRGGVEFGGFEAFNLETFADQLANGGLDAGTKYIEKFKEGLYEAAANAEDPAAAMNQVDAFLLSNESLLAAEEAGRQITAALETGLSEAAQSEAINDVLNGIFGEVEATAEESSAAFRTLMDDVYGVINAEIELANSTRELGEAFATSGSDVAFSGAAMQATISAIYASSTGADDAAARMQGLFNALVEGGYASASQLASLSTIISTLAGGKAVKAATFDMSNFAAGITKVEKAATGGGKRGGSGGAAKAIRTLVDYANDLRGVFSRAFDIRFAGMEGADSIASGWIKIREEIAATNQQIAEYRIEMQSLSADKAIREYWLSVAENYNDALRAGELRAEIAEIDQKLAKSSADLAKEQEKGSRTLVGNSKAAIENRGEILDLVSGYQDYITRLAASGMSQAELQATSARLKQEFMAQATQLGYNANELGTYAAAFDDVSTAIARMPRNITVNTSGLGPAMAALAEFSARIDRTRANAAGGINVPVSTTGGATQGSRDALFTQWAAATQKQYGMALAQNAAGWAIVRAQWERGVYGQFRDGGWTGGGNPWDVAGVVHKREFVLNETGAGMFSRQELEAANQGRRLGGGGGSTTVRMPKTMMVELSPIDRELVASGKPVTVVISADDVGRASSSHFSNDDERGGA